MDITEKANAQFVIFGRKMEKALSADIYMYGMIGGSGVVESFTTLLSLRF